MITQGIEAYSIDHIHGNCIFSKDGTVSMVFGLNQPRKNSLSEQDFDSRTQEFNKAFRFFPENSYVHKQDIYHKVIYDGHSIKRDSFLGRNQQDHFDGRKFIQHISIVVYTLKGLSSLEKAYQSNPFKYDESLQEKDKENLSYFDSNVERSINVINGMKNTSIKALTTNEIDVLLKQLLNGFESSGFYDLNFTNQTFGDGSHFKMLTIHQSEYLPSNYTNVRESDLSSEYQPIYEGFFDGIGETLDCNHIVNQMFCYPGKENIIEELEQSRKEYSKLRKMSEVYDQKYLDLDNIIKASASSEDDLVYAHLNVMVFNKDKDQLNKDFKKLTAHLDTLAVKYYVPSGNVLKNLYLGSIIGHESILHHEFQFVCSLTQGVTFFPQTTVSHNDPEGIYFNDAITQEPRIVDTWDEDNVYMNARNGIICAETGGGKSVLALTLTTQNLEKNVNITVAEFGRSFEFITKLYPKISKHITLKADTPLGVNPFDLNGKSKPSIEKIGYLAEIVMKTWRVIEYMEDTHFQVSIDRILKHYYETETENHSYENFYNFVIDGGSRMLYVLEIEDYFNLKSFKHNCSQFIEGGKYENVFKVNEDVKNHIGDKQLVVFELTEIKKDPFLVTLVLLILQETIDTNVLADKSKKGMLIFDEFAETATIKDMYSNTEVLQTVSVLYQKIRKENGCVYIIVQDLSQLPENSSTKSIYANSQLFYMLPSSRGGYSEVKDVLKLTDSEMAEMQSIRNDFNSEHPYSSFWLKRGEDKIVLRNELSPYSFRAFQTKGEIWKKLNDDFEITKNLEQSIINYKN